MAVKIFLALVTLLACVEFLSASPTRRQLISATEASVSDAPATNEVWDDNDDFDLDGQNWYSQPVASPSMSPEKISDYNDYEDDFVSNNRVNDNAIVDLGEDDDDDEDEDEQQEAEEVVENNANDSEFLFLPPRDTRLLLEDDDDQSGPIKVRHTGRNTYPRVSGGNDNSVESVEEDNEHPYEFAIDEDDQDDDDEDDDPHKDGEIDTAPRHEDHEVDDDGDDEDDEDEFVSEGEDNNMFGNPEEDAAQVIYGDHVFLY